MAKKIVNTTTDSVNSDRFYIPAIATPFGDIDMDELNRFAADLQAEGTETFEAMRYASTLLK